MAALVSPPQTRSRAATRVPASTPSCFTSCSALSSRSSDIADLLFLSEGLRPSDSPTRDLARRLRPARRRPRGSFAPLTRFCFRRAAAQLGLPYSPPRSPPSAGSPPAARLVRAAHSLLLSPSGCATRAPLLATSLAAFGRLAAGREARSRRSLASAFAERLRNSGSPTRHLARRLRPAPPPPPGPVRP